MATYERAGASIYYEEYGSGYPLLLLSPGGMNSTIHFWSRLAFNPIESYADQYHVIAMDQRNSGRSNGPLDAADPWGMYADDQLGLLDKLGISQALMIGCCIGVSFILKLVERAPERVVAGVLLQPIGLDETNPGQFGPRVWTEWGQDLVARRPDLTMEAVDAFGHQMWEQEDFVVSVPRSFVPTVTAPMQVLPGNDRAHPRGVGLELARLLPHAEMVDPWSAPPEIVPRTVQTIRDFLQRHTPVPTASSGPA